MSLLYRWNIHHKNALVNVYITMESHHCLLVAIWLVVWNMNFIFHNIRDNPSHWLSYVSRWLLHHQPVMMIYIYIYDDIWWYTHIILILYSYYTHTILILYSQHFEKLPWLLFWSFPFFKVIFRWVVRRHPIAPQDKPVPNQHEPWAGADHAVSLLYGNFMATLWVIMVMMVILVMMVIMVIKTVILQVA